MRPFPVPRRSAWSCNVSGPVISHSPLPDSLLATDEIRQTGASVTVSVAVTATEIGTVFLFGGHRDVWLGVTAVMAGGVVARTMTLKLVGPVVLCMSGELQTGVVVPNPNVDIDWRVHVPGPAASSGSVAVAENVTTVPLGPM